MKRLLIAGAWIAAWVLVLAVLAGFLTAAVWETSGLPEWAAGAIRAAAADQGVSLRADAIKAGLSRGVVFEGARIRLEAAGVPWTVACHELTVRPRLGPLLRRELEIQEVSFRGMSVQPGLGKDTLRAGLRIERGAGLLRRRPDGTVAATLDALAAKIAVHLEAEVSGVEEALRQGGPGAQAAGSGGHGAPPAGGAPAAATELRGVLEAAEGLLARAQLAERDAYLTGRVLLDLRRPGDLVFDGEAGVANLVFEDLLVTRFHTGVRYEHGQVRFGGVRLILNAGETVLGEACLEPGAGRVSGRCQARLSAETLLRRLPGPPPAWLGGLESSRPVEIRVDLPPSPLDPARWRFTADVAGRDVRLHGLEVSRFTAAGSWDGTVLTVSRWRADLAGHGDEYAEGRLVWHADDQTLEADCEAFCDPAGRMRTAGGRAAARTSRYVEFPAGARFRVQLERSPLDWTRFRGRGAVSAEAARVSGRALGPLAAEFRLESGVAIVESLRAGLEGGPPETFVCDLSADVARALASGTLGLRFGLRARAAAPAAEGDAAEPAPWTEAAAFRGTVLWTASSGAVDITAEGTADPGRWYACWQPRLGLPHYAVAAGVRCAPDAPARVVVNAKRSDSREPLLIRASVAAQRVQYEAVVFDSVRGDIEVTPAGRVCLRNVHALTACGDEAAFDMEVDPDPLRVVFRNGFLRGNPALVEAFLADRDTRAAYHMVWQDFSWGAGHPPSIDVQSLRYRETPGTGAWELTLDGGLQVEAAAFRGLPLRRLHAALRLDLPERVTVEIPCIQTDTATIEGKAEILTRGEPKCSFEVKHLDGGQNPARILSLLHPAWGEALGPLAFASDSAVDCRGSFFLVDDPMLELTGSVRGSWIELRGVRIEAPVAEWGVNRSVVRWNLTSGKLFGGPATLTGMFDLETGRGSAAFRGQDMILERTAAQLGLTLGERARQGLVSGHCRLEILRGWAGRPLQVYGDGALSLREADLWQVPFFDQLGRVLDMTFLNRVTRGKTSTLGRITRLDADFGFTGDRLLVHSLNTDGTILSLRGRGQYCWETDTIELSVNGQALRDSGILGVVFRPLTWAFFNAELRGTSKDCKWRLTTALSKALPGGSD